MFPLRAANRAILPVLWRTPNQAAEDRLKELLEKRKRDKLTRAEVLEVRELQLLKAAAELAKKRAACAADRRKLADQDRYRLGGFALTAGLGGWSDAELRAGFAVLAAMDATQRAELPPVAANADSKAGGDAVAAPVTSATVSTLMPAPMSGAKAAPPAQAQAEPMAAAMPASASMSHESRRFGG